MDLSRPFASNHHDYSFRRYEQLEHCRTLTQDRLTEIYDRFPRLAIEAARVRLLFDHVQAASTYAGHKSRIKENLKWIYGYRNDIVHEGRSKVPGSWIARRLIQGYVHQTLRQTLALAARGSVDTPAEAFALVQEVDQTVELLLQAGETARAFEHILQM